MYLMTDWLFWVLSRINFSRGGGGGEGGASLLHCMSAARDMTVVLYVYVVS